MAAFLGKEAMRYINQFSSCVFLRVFSFFILLSSYSIASAEKSYQFSLGGLVSTDKYSDSGDDDRYGLEAKVYAKPVSLEGGLPYAVADFYKRVSSIMATSSKSNFDNLALVRAGRLLIEQEEREDRIEISIADKRSPIGLDVGYFQIRMHDRYSDGSEIKGQDKDNYFFKPNWFVADYVNLFGIYIGDVENKYSDLYSEKIRTRGFGVRGLYKSEGLGFIEILAKHEIEDVKPVSLIIDRDDFKVDISTISVGYYPTIRSAVGFIYKKTDSETLGITEQYGISYGHHFSPKVSLDLGYSFVVSNRDAKVVSHTQFKSLAAALNFRF